MDSVVWFVVAVEVAVEVAVVNRGGVAREFDRGRLEARTGYTISMIQ